MNHSKTKTVTINGDLNSSLDWTREKAEALSYIEEGNELFWNIQLGLFSKLSFPLPNQTQYLSLELSLDHFKEVIWKEFHLNSIGLCLYSGRADFSINFPWSHEVVQEYHAWLREMGYDESIHDQRLATLFCSDYAVGYLSLLADRLTDEIPCYLILDASEISSPVFEMQLLHPKRFDRFNLIVQGGKLPQNIYDKQRSVGSIGICLPSNSLNKQNEYSRFEGVLEVLLEQNILFRIISESHLTTEWDGLDYLIYDPNYLSIEGRRKLLGFCAAGGAVITLGDRHGFDQEFEWGQIKIDKNWHLG